MKRGLRRSRFAYSLAKKPPKSYADLLERAHKYIRAEEEMAEYRPTDVGPSKKRAKGKPDSSAAPERKERDRGPTSRTAPRKEPRFKYDSFTPLNAPRAQILMEIQGESFLRRPPPMKSRLDRRNMQRYCRFHRERGHYTEHCVELQNEIESLIRRGYLGKFVKGQAPPSAPRPPAAAQPPAAHKEGVHPQGVAGVINVISAGGGSQIEGAAGATGKRQRTTPDITFTEADAAGIQNPHDDAVVVNMTIANFDVKRCLVDNGSSVDVIFYDCFSQMCIPFERLKPSSMPLLGFTGDSVRVEGEIRLPVTAGATPCQATVFLKFLVVRVPSAYNVILGRPGLNALKAVVSTFHLLVQFPTRNGVGEMRGDQRVARQCYLTALQSQGAPENLQIDDRLDQRTQDGRGEPAESLEEVPLFSGDSTRTVLIGSSLKGDLRACLINLLRSNADIFAWTASDMPGIPPEVIVHCLNVDESRKPVRQKKRSFAPERQKAVNNEVDKLLAAGFIREVTYPDWLANVVMVKKASGKWRICIDFTDLNKACPKDSFPLPRIDQLVDATSGHQRLSFMDAFSGYHQIRMKPGDEEKTAFVTDRGLYCYRVMPFGLKNAGATYQRLVNKVFKDQIGRNMEVYVDDMLVKSVSSDSHITDLAESFEALRRHRMRLNPAKCAFGVMAGKFLGYMVTQRGIEANPEKIQALLDMNPPKTLKEVQKLTGRIVSLSRFVSRSAERCLPFFKTLRRTKNFTWSEECQEAFTRLKEYLATPPLLTKPVEGDVLILYIAISDEATSSVLVREEDSVQRPVYYVSRVLKDAETRYSKMEKAVYAIVTATKRLRPYFQAHSVRVLTDLPLRAILQRPETSGRMAKWAVSLSEFDIEFERRPALKAQVLADFLVECATSCADTEEPPTQEEQSRPCWILHVDGASNARGSGAGLILTSADGVISEYALRFGFPTSNNQAEYEALLAGVRIAHELGVKRLKAFTDSQLVTGQVRGDYAARNPVLVKYLQQLKAVVACFDQFEISHIPRTENARADSLSRLASSDYDKIGSTFVEVLDQPSINLEEVAQVSREEGPCWTDLVLLYMHNGGLPPDKQEARRIRRLAAQCAIVDGRLYRRSVTLPLLRCLGPIEADYVLREVHEGICGSHLGGRALSFKVLRQGYYWPTMKKDSADLVRKCDQCQKFANVQRLPSSSLSSISAPWPFDQWGVDILGPFPRASGQRRFVIVAIDYFTKWVEAEALAQITEKKTTDFIWRSIICRFGLPRVIITDNGRQFDNAKFTEFCEKFHINHRFTSVGHPQSNGEAEVTNRTILQGLKARVGRTRGSWADELHSVLWAYRTTPRIPTGETPFRLAFGTEAVIPVEIGEPSLRIEHYDESENSEKRRADIDLVEEVRDQARLRIASYQHRVARYYNARVRPKVFRVGDLVLRRAEVSKPTEGGKLAPRWEGPYKVSGTPFPGAYRLEGLDGTAIPRTWNAENLRMYFQ